MSGGTLAANEGIAPTELPTVIYGKGITAEYKIPIHKKKE